MAEPGTLILGGMALLMLLAGGKKKGNGAAPGPLIDPDNSDPLPPNADTGYLPKGKGYGQQIPGDMSTEDLWVSDDCKAFVVGKNWSPRAYDFDNDVWLTASEWASKPEIKEAFASIYVALVEQSGDTDAPVGGDAIALDFGGQFTARYPGLQRNTDPWTWDQRPVYLPEYWLTADVGIYPSTLPISVRFAIQVLSAVSDAAFSCVDAMPAGTGNMNKQQWMSEFRKWRQKYPVIDFLMGYVIARSVGTTGTGAEPGTGIVGVTDEYLWELQGGIEFG